LQIYSIVSGHGRAGPNLTTERPRKGPDAARSRLPNPSASGLEIATFRRRDDDRFHSAGADRRGVRARTDRGPWGAGAARDGIGACRRRRGAGTPGPHEDGEMPPALAEIAKTLGAPRDTPAALRNEPGETIVSWPPLANFCLVAEVTRVTTVAAEL